MEMIVTPHPIVLDGQKFIRQEIRPGEKLGPFLRRTVEDWADDAWEVRINGVLVPHEMLDRVRPKAEVCLIEVRGIAKKQVLAIIAIAVLAYFTMGAGLGFAGGSLGIAVAGGAGTAATMINAAVWFAGTMIINKVLAPRPPSRSIEQGDPVYSIGSSRNSPRRYESLPLLFGRVQVTPDVVSMPYTWYEGNDQHLGMVLSPGVNVHGIEALYNGETLLSSYEGVSVYRNGFPAHANQAIPLFTNADTTNGAELDHDGTWITRTTSNDTVRIQLNIEYVLGDVTSKGRPKTNRETVVAEYREAGTVGPWLPLASRTFTNNNSRESKRATLTANVEKGQWDVRVHRLGQDTNIENAVAQFQWTTMTSVQSDETDYTGIPRIGLAVKATGQLNGSLDEIRCVAISRAVPVWDGTDWNTELTSNPGAHMLAYARGIYAGSRMLAGIGLDDSMIDIEAFKEFMVHCTENGYKYDACITDRRSHADMCDAIALAGFGQTSWAGGKFGVVWADETQPLNAVVNMATIKASSFQVDYTLANAADGVEFTYVDPDHWEPTTLRIPTPGGDGTMHNPVRITGEGITDEDHAAKMARYHFGQHLYQWKDISFATDLEHITYRRMSLLSLSHDMTQWGYSGRLMAVSVDNDGFLTLTLDNPVPKPPVGNCYIGLRLLGELVFRVFQVEPFVGDTTSVIKLAEAWPEDVPLPGDPAHDTIWTFDFKQTPGYRVRVVQIEPEGDLQGARIAVVPESDEFWNYVNTGEYIPAPVSSLLPTRPVVEGLSAEVMEAIEGDLIVAEINAQWSVRGIAEYCVVYMQQQLEGVWGERVKVAETRTNDARWRVYADGNYRITVVPFAADGTAGISASVTQLIGVPPPRPFDWLIVEVVDGGLRRYSWGYVGDTPLNVVGAELRYMAGSVPTPVWDDMDVFGDGFYTGAFEHSAPGSGNWTFAVKSRDSAGVLSATATVELVTLGDTLQDVLDGLGGDGELTIENPSFEVAEGWGYFPYHPAGTGPRIYFDKIGSEATAPSSGPDYPESWKVRLFRRVTVTGGSGGPKTGQSYIEANYTPSQTSEICTRCDSAADIANVYISSWKYLQPLDYGDTVTLGLPVGSNRALQGIDNVTVGLKLVVFDSTTGVWDGKFYEKSNTTAVGEHMVGGRDYAAHVGATLEIAGTLSDGYGNSVVLNAATHIVAIHSVFIRNYVYIGSSISRRFDDITISKRGRNEVAIERLRADKRGMVNGKDISDTKIASIGVTPTVPMTFRSFFITSSLGEVYDLPTSDTKQYVPDYNMAYSNGTFTWGAKGTTDPEAAMMKLGGTFNNSDGYWQFLLQGARSYLSSDPAGQGRSTVGVNRYGEVEFSGNRYPAPMLAIRDGAIHIVDGGQQIIIGSKFGTTGKLMFYVGPGSDPATANPANAFIYYDSDGNHS